MSDAPVVVIIQYLAQPGQEAQTRQALRELIATVVATEPDCLGIRLHEDPDNAARILLYERWRTRASYTGPHMQTPHLQAFMVAARALVAGPPTIEFWNLVDDLAS